MENSQLSNNNSNSESLLGQDAHVANIVEEVILEEQHHLTEDAYANLGKPELVARFAKLLEQDDVLVHAVSVKAIKEHFTDIVKEEHNDKLSKYIEDGGDKKDFLPAKDEDEKAFDELLKKYNQRRVSQQEEKEKVLKENLRQKKLIIEEIVKISENAATASSGFKRVQEIQTTWRKIGAVPPAEASAVWQLYKHATDRYFEQLNLNNELKELYFKRNFEIKTELCEKIEKLADEQSLKKVFDGLRLIQEEWRETGFGGKDTNEQVLQRFKAGEEKLFERKKAYLAQAESKQTDNLTAKVTICNKLEELSKQNAHSHKDWQDANTKLDALWNEWRKIGPVPASDNNECWKRFKQLRQDFYHLKDAFYIKLREEQHLNLDKKLALCEQAEALQASTDWNKTATTLKRLQEQWKTIGLVPKNKADKVWKRFRQACDKFFESRKTHFAALDNELLDNVKAKELVIEAILALKAGENVNENLQQLGGLQQQWNNIGKAPEADFKRLNKAYKDAVEARMTEVQKGTGGDSTLFSKMRYDYLLQSNEGRNELHKERLTLSNKAKTLKNDITTLENNISFFAKSKNASSLLKEYEDKIAAFKVELAALQKELKAMPLV